MESLGFNVVSYAARFTDKFEPYQIRRHRIMCVTIDNQRYITDVGVNSESPRIPLLLAENIVQSDNISQYKFTRDEFSAGFYGRRKIINHGNDFSALPKNRRLIRISFLPLLV